jgi:hypothetical protein
MILREIGILLIQIQGKQYLLEDLIMKLMSRLLKDHLKIMEILRESGLLKIRKESQEAMRFLNLKILLEQNWLMIKLTERG